MSVQTDHSGAFAGTGPGLDHACSHGPREGGDPWRASVVAEPAEVVLHRAVNDEYRHLVVAAGPEAAAAQPGQFFQLLCPPPPTGEQPFLRRPMSLFGVDRTRRQVAFLYKVAGIGTRGLETLRQGDRLDIMGPLGVGFRLDPAWRHVVAVGRGAGLATLAPLAGAARDAGIGVTAILSARRPDLLVSRDRFEADGATVVAITDQQSTSGPAHVERILRGLIDDGRCDAFFTCGSSRLARVQQRLALEFGLPGQIAMEQQMACGIGLCHCCVRDFNVGGRIVSRRVCWEGPVFDLTEALP
ncbi:MAG: dihydroorotate dehydrogenase electron transfer subunit [Telmatospirillum sp.]|nr:dihydroorotate dehydrogenase electron transfer subunit [Telmatospirillum sp.]